MLMNFGKNLAMLPQVKVVMKGQNYDERQMSQAQKRSC